MTARQLYQDLWAKLRTGHGPKSRRAVLKPCQSIPFCEPCYSLLQCIKENPTWGGGLHHGSYAGFTEAVARGCIICKRCRWKWEDSMLKNEEPAFCIVVDYVVERNRYMRSDLPPITVSIWFNQKDKPAFSWHTFSWHRMKEDVSMPVILRLEPVPSNQEMHRNTRHLLANNTGAKECITLARKWLSTCLETHSTCNRPRPDDLCDWNPNRLIYVGQANNESLRLCEAATLPSVVKYTTLSHCWGKNLVRTTLTQHNLASWLEAILDRELMQTFKDAVKVTRSLGIGYLWIDSLCIIQDSESDWLRESSYMSNIYKYSYCNIAATAAENDNIGCFRNRDPAAESPVRFEFPDLASDISQLSLKESRAGDEDTNVLEGLFDVKWGQPWRDEIKNAPLCHRAWIVQERLLSPRILHFANTQLYWECNESQACESHPLSMPVEQSVLINFKSSDPFNLHRGQFVERYNKYETPLDQVRRKRKVWAAWADIVDTYSQAKLTKQEDKLIALSAVAREMQSLMQCRYLAGHWETDLIRQLGWPGCYVEDRPTPYRAPSWSWASTNGRKGHFRQVYRHMDQYYPMVEIKDVGINLVSDDPMGPVKGGHLVMRGQLYDVKLQKKKAGFDYSEWLKSAQPLTISGRETDLRFCKDGRDTQLGRGSLYCMMLSLCLQEKPIVEGIMLQRCGPPNTYQRVGSVGSDFLDELPKEDPILGLLGKIEWSADGNHKFQKHESDLQTFTIV